MDRKTLVLDPGHGGTTATGGSTPNRGIAANGLFEKDVALDLARRVRERLRTDFTVVLTRESDVNVALAQRAAASRRVAADLFVSIHFSGTPGTQPSTSDVVTTSEPSAASTALARSVLRHVGEVTGAQGVLLEARLGQLAGDRHDPKTAACLVEVASMDDPIQAERLVDDGYRDRLAEALARSIREASADTPTVTPQWVGSRSVARATAVVSPDIDYSVTSLADAGRIWLDWFARYGDWYRGVPNEILHYFPHAGICQLKLYGPNSSTPGFGTGFYIADEVLLTCGHNFFYPPHNFVANRVEVLPAYSPNMSILPAKEFAVSGTTLVHPRWLSSNGTDRGFDLAVLPVPGLPATAGTFSLPNMSLEPSAQVVVCGYGKQASSPNLTTAQWLAEMESQGQRMDGATITNVDPELAFYPIQTLGGHSGSPVFHESMLIAVHTGPRILNTAAGMSISPHENRGVLLTPDKNDWIVQQAGGGVSIGLSAGSGRARALQVTSDSTQREQSDEVRLRVARSVGLAEAGGRYDLVHDDSNRINFGIGSWTGTRIADVLDTYAAFRGRQRAHRTDARSLRWRGAVRRNPRSVPGLRDGDDDDACGAGTVVRARRGHGADRRTGPASCRRPDHGPGGDRERRATVVPVHRRRNGSDQRDRRPRPGARTASSWRGRAPSDPQQRDGSLRRRGRTRSRDGCGVDHRTGRTGPDRRGSRRACGVAVPRRRDRALPTPVRQPRRLDPLLLLPSGVDLDGRSVHRIPRNSLRRFSGQVRPLRSIRLACATCCSSRPGPWSFPGHLVIALLPSFSTLCRCQHRRRRLRGFGGCRFDNGIVHDHGFGDRCCGERLDELGVVHHHRRPGLADRRP